MSLPARPAQEVGSSGPTNDAARPQAFNTLSDADRSTASAEAERVEAENREPRFTSLLFNKDPGESGLGHPSDRSFFSDLNLDQLIDAISGDREERELILSLLYGQLHDSDSIRFRLEIFRDLEDQELFGEIQQLVELLGRVRLHLAQLDKMHSKFQREGWFLNAVSIYCDVIHRLRKCLDAAPLRSRGLLQFRSFLTAYADSSTFSELATESRHQKDVLGEICYCVRIRGNRVEVSRYHDEADYSAEVLATFERFKQGSVKDYRVRYRGWPGMNHVGEQILDLVARLFPEEFAALDDYCERRRDFFAKAVRTFEREVQFYLAFLEYIKPLRVAGLSFCYPETSEESKEIFASDTFDLTLAKKLVGDGRAVVTNEFSLSGQERIFVVSGPNQGGKTTFARMFGQLHHLASIGCPVPGTAARLFLFDQLFTHFEREEDLVRMTGKLEDDLVRIREVLEVATSKSILIMNEMFTSTTLSDAQFLGKKVMQKVIDLDLLCVYVTFVDELASMGDSVVSMLSTIVPGNPAERTYKVVRGPADGLAYALAIAEKYDLTYDRLSRRLLG